MGIGFQYCPQEMLEDIKVRLLVAVSHAGTPLDCKA
jgi:hypothetical protein